MNNYIQTINYENVGIDNLDLIYEFPEVLRKPPESLKRNPYYQKAERVWHQMKVRAKAPESIKRTKPWYIGTKVCKEWEQDKSCFIEWYLRHIFNLSDDTIDLDKDLLSGDEKVYSPATCLLLPHKINIFLSSIHKKSDNGLPIGVTKNHYGRFVTQMNFKNLQSEGINATAKRYKTFKTLDEAYQVWRLHKRCQYKALIASYGDELPDYLREILLNYDICGKLD